MLFALTFEQALSYEPALMPAALCAPEPTLIASGERAPTSWGRQLESRREFTARRTERCWKQHRRVQHGSFRV